MLKRKIHHLMIIKPEKKIIEKTRTNLKPNFDGPLKVGVDPCANSLK